MLDLRPGKASPWNKTDHVTTVDAALDRLPAGARDRMLVRADTGACSKLFLHHITELGLEYSIGSWDQDRGKAAVEAIPEQAWRAAVDSDGEAREGAQVAELTAWMPARTRRTGGRVRDSGLAERDAGHRAT
ncbi:hypothetical protein [Nocardioides sp. LHD-245]|uniref:hypothetical protein n=1 Tax=Nocardioides sp. LHD-245 TaxID=3051387 RepID=UPI003709A566